MCSLERKVAHKGKARCNPAQVCYNGHERREGMKITLNQDPSYRETEVIINCAQADEDILRLVAMLRVYQKKLVGILDGERHLLDVKDILYIDTADKKTFLYTERQCSRALCGSTSWRRTCGSWTFSERDGLSS